MNETPFHCARVAAIAVVLLGCSSEMPPPPDEPDAGPTCEELTNACGGCGTSCDQGGTCRNAACDVPITLARSLQSPWSIARDADYVYFTSFGFADGKVMRARRDASETEALELATAQKRAWGIAVDAGDVFWTNAGTPTGSVMKLAAGGDLPVELAGGLEQPQGIALDATHVYVTIVGSASVLRIPRDGGEPVVVAERLGVPEALALDDSRLYVTDSLGGRVLAVPLDGGEPLVLAEGQSMPSAIAVDAQAAFFSTRGAGGVWRVPLDASAPPTLLTIGYAPSGITLDETNVYFSDEGARPETGTISSVPKEGGDVMLLAGGQDEPWAVAVDDSSVYWTNVRGGTVLATGK